jgi:RHS repeat-associated protein
MPSWEGLLSNQNCELTSGPGMVLLTNATWTAHLRCRCTRLRIIVWLFVLASLTVILSGLCRMGMVHEQSDALERLRESYEVSANWETGNVVRITLHPGAKSSLGREEARALQVFERLRSLACFGLHIQAAALSELEKVPAITALRVDDPRLSDTDLALVARVRSLRFLSIIEGNISAAGIENLAPLVQLEALNLAGTTIDDHVIVKLSAFPGLRSLVLANTAITDNGLRDIRVLPNLRHLHLAGTRISDLGLSELAKLSDLAMLNLNHTAITDEGLEAIAQLQNLKFVAIQDTKVTADGLAKLKSNCPSVYMEGEFCEDVRDPSTSSPLQPLKSLLLRKTALVHRRSNEHLSTKPEPKQEIEGSSALIAHDRAGNMTTIPRPGDNSDDYAMTWDAWNRLVAVEDGENTVAEYEYDGSNRRAVKKTYTAGSLDQTRHFYYTDQWQCVEERDESGGAIAANPDVQYVWGDRYVDDLILRDRDADNDGQTGSLGGTGSGLEERLYALHDANWNVTALAEADGDVVERFTYTAYGAVTVLDGDFSSDADGASDKAWIYTYTTRRLDAETGLMYYRNRMYHPALGRFISRDPIGYDAEDVNLYRYLGNSPRSYVDPIGTDRRLVGWGAFHLVIEIRNRETGETWFLDFGPDWFGGGSGGYSAYKGYYTPGRVPITDWLRTTPEEDQKLIDRWNEWESKRRQGQLWDWNPINNCWVPATSGFLGGIDGFPPTSFPPGWNPGKHACMNCHSPEVQEWRVATPKQRAAW